MVDGRVSARHNHRTEKPTAIRHNHPPPDKDGAVADLKPLIAYLIDQVRDQEGKPNKTTLVKLVYLVDVEHCRRYGKPVTGLEWRFHHYGPYAAELDREIDDNTLFQVFGNRGTGYGFSPSPAWRDIQAAFSTSYGPTVKRIADDVAKQWGLETLDTVLEYVYFDTEPMQNAERGETLDFSKIQVEGISTRREPRLSFSDEFISDLRTRWNQRKETRRNVNPRPETPEEPLYDEVYQEALDMMAREEGTTPTFPRRRPLKGSDRSGTG